MQHQKIEFQRQRDLGETISDTFAFIRQNFKPLLKSIFKITGPVFLILLLAIGYYSYLGMDILSNPFFATESNFNVTQYIISLFILFSSLLAFYVLLNTTVLHFIRSYIKNGGVINETEIYSGVKNDFGGMLALLILSGIMTIFGLLLCILPGIYIWVPLSLAPAALVFYQDSVTDSIRSGFKLIKNNWWSTFFTLFVIVILVYIIGLIFQVPLMIYIFIKAFTASQEGSIGDPSTLFDGVYVVLNVISSLAQYLLSTIVIIASAFIFYSLDEKKNLTGTYRTISNLGSSEEK